MSTQATQRSAEEKTQAAAASPEDWKQRTCRVFFEDKHQDLLWVVIKEGWIVDCNLQHWLWCGLEVLQQPKVGQLLHILWEVGPKGRLLPGCTRVRITKVEDELKPIRPYPPNWLEQHPIAARGLAAAGVGADVAVRS